VTKAEIAGTSDQFVVAHSRVIPHRLYEKTFGFESIAALLAFLESQLFCNLRSNLHSRQGSDRADSLLLLTKVHHHARSPEQIEETADDPRKYRSTPNPGKNQTTKQQSDEAACPPDSSHQVSPFSCC
jgi:hypothetical protein